MNTKDANILNHKAVHDGRNLYITCWGCQRQYVQADNPNQSRSVGENAARAGWTALKSHHVLCKECSKHHAIAFG